MVLASALKPLGCYSGMALAAVLLASCQSGDDAGVARKALPVPERLEENFITDQLDIAQQVLYLWSEDGGCKLQIMVKGKQQGDKQWLKPTAPCYFIKSPGSQRVQVYQRDKTTRVVALLGTAVAAKKPGRRCGRELQGLVIDGKGVVRPSTNTQSGSIYCADQGLDNFQYTLFNVH